MLTRISSLVILACLTFPVYAEHPNHMNQNPLLIESTLPLHYPRFDLIKTEHYGPAFDQGMREQLSEIDLIANLSEKPTFENTLVAMEKSGGLLTRVSNIFFQQSSVNTNPELQKIQLDYAPLLAAHADAILLNQKLFARIAALYELRDTLELDAESQRLLWRYYQDFVRAGAKLAAADQAKLKKMNGMKLSGVMP